MTYTRRTRAITLAVNACANKKDGTCPIVMTDMIPYFAKIAKIAAPSQ